MAGFDQLSATVCVPAHEDQESHSRRARTRRTNPGARQQMLEQVGRGTAQQHGTPADGSKSDGVMARRAMGRAATVANDSGSNRNRRREVECDRRGGYAGAAVTDDSRSGSQTGGSNCGAVGPAAAV